MRFLEWSPAVPREAALGGWKRGWWTSKSSTQVRVLLAHYMPYESCSSFGVSACHLQMQVWIPQDSEVLEGRTLCSVYFTSLGTNVLSAVVDQIFVLNKWVNEFLSPRQTGSFQGTALLLSLFYYIIQQCESPSNIQFCTASSNLQISS